MGQYNAFISYKREFDREIATAVQTALQKFAKPWFRARSLRVFRDDASLSANPDLWASVATALRESEFLILFASPAAAASEWVQREVDLWLAEKSIDTLLLAVTAGAIIELEGQNSLDLARTTALPPNLAARYVRAPRYVDLSWVHKEVHLSLSDPRFRECVADLGAPLHHKAKADIIGDEVREHRRTMNVVRATIAVLSILVIVAAAAAFVANSQRQAALDQLRIATSRQVASSSLIQASTDPHLGALLALGAFQVDDTPEAEGALLKALENLPAVAKVVPAGSSAVNAVANSPDGRSVASGGADGVVTLRTVEDPQQHEELRSALNSVKSIAFSPDGRLLAAGGEGESPYGPGQLVVWDLMSRSEIISMPAHWFGVQALAFSPDSRLVAFGGGHKAAPQDADNPFGLDVAVWNVATNTQVVALGGHTNSVLGLAFSPDGKTLFSGGYSGVLIWDIGTGALLAKPFDSAQAIGLSVDGSVLAVGTTGTVTLWDVASRSVIGTLLDDGVSFFTPTSLAFSPDDATLAAAGKSGFEGIDSARLTLWNLRSRSQIGSLTGHTGPISSIAFGRDSRSLISGGEDARLFFWSLTGYPGIRRSLATSAEAVSDPEFTYDGRQLVGIERRAEVGSVPNAQVWSVASGAAESRDEFAGKQIVAKVETPTGTVVAQVVPGGVAVVDLAGGTQLGLIPFAAADLGTGLSTIDFAFSRDGSQLSISSPAGGLDLWTRSAPSGVSNIIGPYGHGFSSATFDATGSRIAAYGSGMLANNVFVWDARTRAEVTKLDSRGEYIAGLAFSPDGSTIAGIGLNGKAYLWNLASPDPIAIMTGHTASGSSVAFSPDGKVLATGSTNEVVLWDVARRVEIGSLPASSNSVGQLTFGPDGRTLAVGGLDAALWNVDPQTWRSQLCAVVGRNLTREEWATYVSAMDYQRVCENYE